jgi:NAD(P)-dependent dehydrogenase (short-subunit alcohol dehydrogenase family)
VWRISPSDPRRSIMHRLRQYPSTVEKCSETTGASKGIGAGVALSLAKEGAAVAVNYASDREGADRVVEKIKTAGGKAIAVQGSVTSSEEIDRFFNETEIGLIAAFLASEKARWITGEIIFGSGGFR